MPCPLNVIALLSGGKDSLYSLLHCQANGHHVVALANLHPAPSAGDEDMNSFLYQTVGHAVLPLYEQALGLPLHRHPITGTAVHSSREYQASPSAQHDETEDLLSLLQRVMLAHPNANALSTGAILSTYQRTRVESVALRLHLTPLSYLWQYPILPPYRQTSLLHDMAAVGQEAIIVKTASGGLDERFLGCNLASQTTLSSLQHALARFSDATDGAILGEGGEFETLAVDGPSPLWKAKIGLPLRQPTMAATTTTTMAGGQTVLDLPHAVLHEKPDTDTATATTCKKPRIPSLFDDEFAAVLNTRVVRDKRPSPLSGDMPSPIRLALPSERLPRNASYPTPTLLTCCNFVHHGALSPERCDSSCQLAAILHRLDHALTQWALNKADVNHCTMLLRDMADFASLHSVYGQYFDTVNPPARVTVAVGDGMPKGTDVMLSIQADRTKSQGRVRKAKIDRQGLHVQGRSYWAPANIGPYSQAISVRLPTAAHDPTDHDKSEDGSDDGGGDGGGKVVYMAGQIPLVPASMQPYHDQGFRGQAVLSLQHLWRIGRAKGVKWWSAAVAFVSIGNNNHDRDGDDDDDDDDDGNLDRHVHVVQEIWQTIHSLAASSHSLDTDGDTEEAVVDPWDRLNRFTSPSFNDATYRSPLPDTTCLLSRATSQSPSTTHPPSSSPPLVSPCFVVQVQSLPRNVQIEWTATGLTSSSVHLDRSSGDSPKDGPSQAIHLTTTRPIGSQSSFCSLEIRHAADMELLQRLAAKARDGHWTSGTFYVTPAFCPSSGGDGDGSAADVEWEEETRRQLQGIQWIPCRRVWGEAGREVTAVLVGRIDEE